MAARNFQEFFRNSIKPLLREEELKRISIRNKLLAYIFLSFLIISAGIIIFLVYEGNDVSIIVLSALLLLAVVLLIIQFNKLKKFRTAFKKKIIPRLLNFIDQGLQYNPREHIPRMDYMKSKIFLTRPDRYKGEDLVYGAYKGIPLKFSELKTEYKTTTTNSKGQRRQQWHTIFKGVFFVADFNKHFKGRTVVLPDTAEKLFGKFGQSLQSMNFARDQLIKMDNPVFEKSFVVYSTDQIEARYVLSTSLMQRILDFKDKLNSRLYVSFVDSKVNIGIPYRNNLFEVRIFNPIDNIEFIEDLYHKLLFFIEIIDELNLNLRIWTKE